MITTIDEAMEVLMSYIPAPGLMHHNYKLERMQSLMALLDNPQDSYKVIHIAGTSGKTSTAYFVRGLLQAAGAKTGLTVSPHIQSITERIQIDGKPINDKQFVDHLNNLLAKVTKSDLRPTYFELLVALAYMVFREEKVDYAVVETGLGGLLDGTNVVTRADKLCVITDIGLDHTEILGKTLPEIARQKSGIVQRANQVIIQHQDPEIEAVLKQDALDRGASRVDFVPPGYANGAETLPAFQQRNWAAAVTAYQTVAQRDNLPDISAINSHSVQYQQPPGRMEEFKVGDKTVIMDGAHNPQKLHALVESLQARGMTSVDVLVSFVSNEPEKLEECLRVLQPITKTMVVTDFSVMRDVGKSASSADDITAIAQKLEFQSVTQIANPQQAMEHILSTSGQVVLVTGSLYLVAQLRQVAASSV